MRIKTSYKAFLIIVIFLVGPAGRISGIPTTNSSNKPKSMGIDNNLDLLDNKDIDNGITQPSNSTLLSEGSNYQEDFNVGSFLSDNDNNYTKKWDPWITKAAIHSIATTDDGYMMALGGGYLYDNEIHLYRWNQVEEKYDLTAEIGSEIFNSDVLTLEFADTDHNNLTEIVAGSEDGHIYVFEQTHIYDPNTNLETNFDLVWRSDRLGRIHDLVIKDVDGDAKKDIIVGTGYTVRWYEYEDHGGYPFSEDHWIEFEQVFSYTMTSLTTAIGVSDVNDNGLYEVVVGMQSGEIQLLQNNGTELYINGQPYPVMQDNSYKPIWSSNETIRRAISDISGGDLDSDGSKELVIAAQGQGAYVLDQFDDQIGLFRLERPFESWETSDAEIHTLDHYIDWILNSSSLQSQNGTEYEYRSDYNVFFGASNGTDYPEPLNDSVIEDFPSIYPHRTALAQDPNGEYSYFNGIERPAWAVLDFSYDEEAAGNGLNNVHDLVIDVDTASLPPDQLQLSISQDNNNYYEINSSYISIEFGQYNIEVDPTLNEASLNHFRYLKINVTGGEVGISNIRTKYINNPIYDSLSTEIGPLRLKNNNVSQTAGFIGTIDGTVLGIVWNDTAAEYQIVWDSYKEERFKLRKNIFDLELIRKESRFPALIKDSSTSYSIDVSTTTLPDGGDVVSYEAANFYNYLNERNTEFIISSSNGNLYAYRQDSPNGEPVYSPDLTSSLFQQSNGVQEYIDTYLSNNDYIAVSLVPIDQIFKDIYSSLTVSPSDNGYYLFLSSWNGTMGNTGLGGDNPSDEEIEVTLWYLEHSVNDGSCGDLTQCVEFKHFPRYDAPSSPSNLKYMDQTGQMENLLKSSTWMPKLSSAELTGDSINDFILTNGKVHLLENVMTKSDDIDEQAIISNLENQQLIDNGYVEDNVYTKFDIFVKGDYFDTINDNSKGRHWTNAEPVNFDGDSDFDLILGFARYTESLFGVNNTNYGMTYWENQGTVNDPQWVERKKAVTNNDKDSNLQNQNFTDPVLLFEDYKFPNDEFDTDLGYHPMYAEELPTKLTMFQVDSNTDIFKGYIQSFDAVYNHQSSLLAATYPEVQRMDINLQYEKSTDKKRINYGFHIFETWDNKEELNEWTISMDTADVDQDGKNEVVVGDFSNNIYVFEHLTNNSFKRAYKSNNINRTVQATETPYQYEDFGGIDGEFTRTIFDHIKYLEAGSDLNNNGQKEFIGVTENMVFIFENTRTPTNQLRDDSYQLVKMIDLYELIELNNLDMDEIKVSAVTTADDMTGNSLDELILAVSSALLIFEVGNSWSLNEVFFRGQLDDGLYNMPGNHFLYPDYQINDIMVDDIDKDGIPDLTIAGTDKREARPIYSGFVNIVEWKNQTLNFVARNFVFEESTEYTPVNVVSTDDSDLDGNKELILGHENGISIYESVSNDNFELRETISNNPHYQLPERYYFNHNNPDGAKIVGYHDIERDHTSGALKMAYVVENFDPKSQNVSWIVLATSLDDGETWTVDGYLNYVPDSTPSGDHLGPTEVDIQYHSSGNLWLSFIDRYKDTFTGEIILANYVIRNPNPDVSNNAYQVFTERTTSGEKDIITPRLFNLYNLSYYPDPIMGLAVNYNLDSSRSMVFLRLNASEFGSSLPYDIFRDVPFAQNTNATNYNIHSFDIIQYRELSSKLNKYGLAFSAYRYGEEQSLDRDIFFSEFTIKNRSAFTFEVSQPTRTFSSGISSTYPSLTFDEQSGSTIIAFNHDKQDAYAGLHGVWSSDLIEWDGPHRMTHPLGVDNPDLIPFSTSSGESYITSTADGGSIINHFNASRPALTYLPDGGYTMVYGLYSDYNRGSFGPCSNKDSSGTDSEIQFELNCYLRGGRQLVSAIQSFDKFVLEHGIEDVSDIAIGDSDRDNRHEILVATDKTAQLLEFEGNQLNQITHDLVWTSQEYDRSVTSVAISDLNSNNYPEIIIESERGVVQSFEVSQPQEEVDLVFPQRILTSTQTSSSNNPITVIKTVNANSDGVEDIIYRTATGQIAALDGNTLTDLWSGPRQTGSSSVKSPFKDHLAINYDNGNPAYVVVAHDGIVNLYDIETGSLVTGQDFISRSVTAIELVQLDTDSLSEIVVALDDGEIQTLDISGSTFDTSAIHQLSLNSNSFVADIKMGNYTSGNQIALVERFGNITIIDKNGGFVTNRDYPTDLLANENTLTDDLYMDLKNKTTVGVIQADLNSDGFDDLVFGSNLSIAMSGKTGDVIWNKTWGDYLISSQTPIAKDFNDDSIPDIAYSMVYQIRDESSRKVNVRLNGIDGNLLGAQKVQFDYMRSYSPELSYGNITTDATRDVLLTPVVGYSTYFSIFAGAGVHEWTNATILTDSTTGQSAGAISSDARINSVASSHLGFDREVVITGDKNGKLHIYKLYEGQPEITQIDGDNQVRQDSDHRIPTEIEDDHGVITYDVNSDGIEDTIYIRNEIVTAYDTDQALQGGDTILFEKELPFGQFLGEYTITDLDNNGNTDILLGFEDGLVALALSAADNYDILWGNIDNYSTQASNIPSDIDTEAPFTRMELDITSSDAFVNDIAIVSTNFINNGDPFTSIRYIDQTSGDELFGYNYPGTEDVHQEIANIDSDSPEEFTFSYRYANDSFRHWVFVVENNSTLTTFYELEWEGIGPITDISAGEFDNIEYGNELVFDIDYSLVDEDYGYKFDNIPSKYIVLAFDEFQLMENRLKIPNVEDLPQTFMGISTADGHTLQRWITDTDADGNDDILIETDRGELLTVNTEVTSTVHYDVSPELKNIAFSSRGSTARGDFCETDSFVTITGYNRISCFSNAANFSRNVNLEWDRFLETEIIEGIHKATLDGDPLDDLFVFGFEGDLWWLQSGNQLNSIENDNNQLKQFIDNGMSNLSKTLLYLLPTLFICTITTVVLLKQKDML